MNYMSKSLVQEVIKYCTSEVVFKRVKEIDQISLDLLSKILLSLFYVSQSNTGKDKTLGLLQLLLI